MEKEKYFQEDSNSIRDSFKNLGSKIESDTGISNPLDKISDEDKQLGRGIGDLIKQGIVKGKNTKSLAGMAAKNTFEFPVFVSKSVPLDYATATNSLLEQLYASYLQMAISLDPVVDRNVALSSSGPFAKYKTNITQYVEYTDSFYMHDACHNRIQLEDGSVCEFDMISITDAEAQVINEAVDYQPLSEFAHYFQEANDKSPTDDELMNGPFTPSDMESTRTTTGSGSSTTKTTSTRKGSTSGEKDTRKNSYSTGNGGAGAAGGGRAGGNTRGHDHEESTSNSTDRSVSNQTGTDTSNSTSVDKPSEATRKIENVRLNTALLKYRTAQKEYIEAQHRVERLQQSDTQQDAQTKQAQEQAEKARVEALKALKELETTAYELQPDGTRREFSYEDEIIRKRKKLYTDHQLSVAQLSKLMGELEKDEDRWRMERERHMKDMMLRSPQYMDETKIQKLNTMKPLMLTVQLRLTTKTGGVTEPVEYVVGVKTHSRLIDPDILPEVAQYPLKQMNQITRKVKWRAKEIKWFDYVFKRKEKKQTAIDSKDPRRKWYRRLYELAHKKGDSVVSGLISGNYASGLIPNATIVMSQTDVDNIKMQTGINLLDGKKGKKFCTELFLMSLIVIDLDAESIKILQPDTSNDFEVHSLASVKKQLATLDTAGDKTRDIFKLLGR